MISRRHALLAGLGFASRLGAAQPHPLYFEPNRGQFGAGPVFCTDQKRWRASFEADSIDVTMKRLVGDGGGAGGVRNHAGLRDVRVTLLGVQCPAPVGEDRRVGRSDYYFHGDPKTFVNDVPHFYRLRYREAWPGVDLLVRGWEGLLEIGFDLSAEADAASIGLRWTQGEPLSQRDGSIVVPTPWGAVRQLRPDGRSWRVDANGVLRLA